MSGERELAGLRNLGPASARWLGDVGIVTEAQLRAVGAVHAFRLVAMAGHRPSLNLAYAIEAALRDLHWTALPEDVRRSIAEELRSPWDPRDLPAIPL